MTSTLSFGVHPKRGIQYNQGPCQSSNLELTWEAHWAYVTQPLSLACSTCLSCYSSLSHCLFRKGLTIFKSVQQHLKALSTCPSPECEPKQVCSACLDSPRDISSAECKKSRPMKSTATTVFQSQWTFWICCWVVKCILHIYYTYITHISHHFVQLSISPSPLLPFAASGQRPHRKPRSQKTRTAAVPQPRPKTTPKSTASKGFKMEVNGSQLFNDVSTTFNGKV